jgi:hypothetical protein
MAARMLSTADGVDRTVEAALARAGRSLEFKAWARGWLSGADQTARTAANVRMSLEVRLQEPKKKGQRWVDGADEIRLLATVAQAAQASAEMDVANARVRELRQVVSPDRIVSRYQIISLWERRAEEAGANARIATREANSKLGAEGSADQDDEHDD